MQQYCEASEITKTAAPVSPILGAEQRHAIAVAATTAAAAEAAAVTAQAAVEIARLTRQPASSFATQPYWAAVVIQTAFRGYLVINYCLYLCIIS